MHRTELETMSERAGQRGEERARCSRGVSRGKGGGNCAIQEGERRGRGSEGVREGTAARHRW